MQSRTPAIILSLGMLLEAVDTKGFITTLLGKAAQENPEFKFTPDLQKQAFSLSETLNKGEKTPEEFEKQLLQVLGIKTLGSDEFWLEWNKMIILGNLPEKIKLLQDMAHQHNALIYLSSDTNVKHLEKITTEIAEQKMVELDSTKQPMLLGSFPLYVSCKVGQNRQELIKHIVKDIQSKEFNKPDAITLVLGAPENIKEKSHQAVAQRECDAITAWCKQNDVSVSLHNNDNSLERTLTGILAPEISASNTLSLTC